MSAYLSPTGDPGCLSCGCSLSSLPARGRCPHCNQPYDTDRPAAAPGLRRDAVVVARSVTWLASHFAMTWRNAAVLALTIGNAAMVIAIAVYGYITFLHAIGL